MKTFLNFCTGLFLTTSLLLINTSCEKLNGVDPLPLAPPPTGTNPPVPNGPGDFKIIKFDPMMMKTKIDAFLNARNLSGYAYTIFVDGQRVANAEGRGGLARKSIDSPQREHHPMVRQEIASCSKYITTLAMVQMLDRADLSLDTDIGAYLPAYMNAIASVRTISFRQLLSHYSGLVGGVSDTNITLAEMQQSVRTNNTAGFDSYQYNNMNFALCRLLLSYVYWIEVLNMSPQTIAQMETNPTNLDTGMANIFLSFVRNDVFKPAGLSAWGALGATDPGTNSPTLYYSNNLGGVAGINPSSLTTIVNLGSAGFDLNAVELTQITSAANDYKIVSEPMMKAIRTGYKGRPLGFNDSQTGKYGEYYYKYGGITPNANGLTGGLNTMLVDFDCPTARVQVAVMANQADNGVSNINWIQAAFDQSWK
ncbi:MAG: beta-lactamase family protein [Rudanella sp.]|nr:beta-lactamase family protein [Rudanella sp.]